MNEPVCIAVVFFWGPQNDEPFLKGEIGFLGKFIFENGEGIRGIGSMYEI